MEKVFGVLRGSVSATYRGERFFASPWGLLGGQAGQSARSYVIRKTGETEEIPAKRDLILNEGDRLHVFSQGGGGYGDPLKRKPQLVLRDVLNKRVFLEIANDVYGVVIDPEQMNIDYQKTGALRLKKVQQRGPITWTYDRGPQLGRE